MLGQKPVPTAQPKRPSWRTAAPDWRVVLGRPELGSVAGFAVVWVIFAILAGGSGFLSIAGTANYLDVAAQVGIVGTAATLLIISGNFDLSIGSMVGASGMILALAIGTFHWPVAVAILAAFAFALFYGFLNGYVVCKTGLHSFIVTLASLYLLRGGTIIISRTVTGGPIQVGLLPYLKGNPIASLFTAELGPIHVDILWWLGLAVVSAWVLTETRFGNWILGTGGSATSARAVGVPVNRVKILLFMFTAGSAALLATTQVLRVGSSDALLGTNKEFEAIITAVIGGALLSGGWGSAVGSVLGALTVGVISQGLFFAGVESDYYQAILGVLLLVAVLINEAARRTAFQGRT